LKANKWKQVEIVSHLRYRNTAGSTGLPNVGSFLNGFIHWLVYNCQTKRNVIIAFNLKEMTMSEIALPDDFSSGSYDLLISAGGRISVWKVKESTIKISVMQEYAVHSSWTKILDFSSLHALYFFSPVCYTNCGDIVGPNANAGLVKFNDKGQLLEYHSFGGSYFVRSQWRCIQSLCFHSLTALSRLTSDTKQEEFDYEIFVFTILLIFILYYELGIMKHGK